jgi:hypothetical protein
MAVISSPIEPAQRKALLVAHEAAKRSKVNLTSVANDLLKAGFTERQLFGNGSRDSEGRSMSPGLLRMGIIGDKVPTDAQLYSVRKEVEKKSA